MAFFLSSMLAFFPTQTKQWSPRSKMNTKNESLPMLHNYERIVVKKTRHKSSYKVGVYSNAQKRPWEKNSFEYILFYKCWPTPRDSWKKHSITYCQRLHNTYIEALGSVYTGPTEYLVGQIFGHLGVAFTRSVKFSHLGVQIFGRLGKRPLELGRSSSQTAPCERLWPAKYLHGNRKRVSICD